MEYFFFFWNQSLIKFFVTPVYGQHFPLTRCLLTGFNKLTKYIVILDCDRRFIYPFPFAYLTI